MAPKRVYGKKSFFAVPKKELEEKLEVGITAIVILGYRSGLW